MASRAANNNFIQTVQEASTSGWVGDDETHTWTLSSTVTTADADVYVVNVDADVTGYIGANMKVRLEDGGTVKYFGVLSVGAYSAGVTPVYLFGGTDYVLSGTITAPAYSSARAPFGFPMNKNKWKITVTDVTYRSQAAPTIYVWYNVGGTNEQIIVPKGLWEIGYKAFVSGNSSTGSTEIWTTLSTANNTESDSSFTNIEYVFGANSSIPLVGNVMRAEGIVEITSDTTYYLNLSFAAGATLLYTGGNTTPTVLYAVWGGL